MLSITTNNDAVAQSTLLHYSMLIMNTNEQTNTSRHQVTKRVTWVSIVLNTLLAIVKVLFGVIGQSHALVADGLHSFSDLLTDGLVLIASKAGNKQPDKEHPYGHHRIETFATLIIAIILILVGIALASNVINDLINHITFKKPSLSILIVALGSIAVNEWLFRYTLFQARKIHSQLLTTNAWHHRSDALTSLIVLISAVGMMFGIPYLDAIAAVIIALIIMKMGIKMIWNSIKELIDTGVDDDTLDDILKNTQQIPGVAAVHQVRTRLLGGYIFVDAHIQVDSYISVSEGHHTGDQVQRSLRQLNPLIADVTIHIDPEDDETCSPSSHLLNRAELSKKLNHAWKSLPGFTTISTMQLHYLDGNLQLMLIFNESTPSDYHARQQQYQQAAQHAVEHIDSVQCAYHPQ